MAYLEYELQGLEPRAYQGVVRNAHVDPNLLQAALLVRSHLGRLSDVIHAKEWGCLHWEPVVFRGGLAEATMEHLWDWTRLFRALTTGDAYPALRLVRARRLVNWRAVVREWEAELLHLSAPMISGHGFTLEVLFPTEIGGSYPLVWDVTRAQALIRTHRIPLREWWASDLKPFARTGSAGDSPHLSTPGPIIWAGFKFSTLHGVVIDGNHRVERALPSSWLPAYELPEVMLVEALAADTYRTFYRWHDCISNWTWAESAQGRIPDIRIPDRFRL